MQACINEHMGTSFYNNYKNFTGEIILSRIELDEGGYANSGKYYGIGAPLFLVEICPDHTDLEDGGHHMIRMRGSNVANGVQSRKELRAALQKIYPNMSVKR